MFSCLFAVVAFSANAGSDEGTWHRVEDRLIKRSGQVTVTVMVTRGVPQYAVTLPCPELANFRTVTYEWADREENATANVGCNGVVVCMPARILRRHVGKLPPEKIEKQKPREVFIEPHKMENLV